MDSEQFLKMVRRDGFSEVVRVAREPGTMLKSHTHPLEAKALLLDREIRITTVAGDRTYRAGDIFHLRSEEVHAAFYGPQWVQYLVGRK